MLYFISQRVLPEEKHREYREVFRLLEQLTSKFHDGLLRQSEIRAFTAEAKLDATFANQLDQLFERFSQQSEITPSETLHSKRRKARKEKKAKKQSKKMQKSSRYDENDCSDDLVSEPLSLAPAHDYILTLSDFIAASIELSGSIST